MGAIEGANRIPLAISGLFELTAYQGTVILGVIPRIKAIAFGRGIHHRSFFAGNQTGNAIINSIVNSIELRAVDSISGVRPYKARRYVLNNAAVGFIGRIFCRAFIDNTTNGDNTYFVGCSTAATRVITNTGKGIGATVDGNRGLACTTSSN